MDWWIYLIIALLIFVVIPVFIMLFVVPIPIFDALFARKSKEKWSRNAPSDTSNEEMVRMWDIALDFQTSYHKNKEDVHLLTEDGFNLYGEYYDFGGDKTVIIMPGRPETLVYSLFYAESYRKANVNVMVFDPRAHGLSDGKYHGCGYMEKYDIFAACQWLMQSKGIKKMILHGICVGSSACAMAASDPDRPSNIIGLVTDGAYSTFYDTLWIRIRRNAKINPFTCISYFRRRIKTLYGYDIKKDGPLYRFPHLTLPVLMMASKEDIYSLPVKTQQLYDALPSSIEKKLVWFPKGAHSHLRIVNPSLYDASIAEFVASFCKQ